VDVPRRLVVVDAPRRLAVVDVPRPSGVGLGAAEPGDGPEYLATDTPDGGLVPGALRSDADRPAGRVDGAHRPQARSVSSWPTRFRMVCRFRCPRS
jgi:hypothetical protein